MSRAHELQDREYATLRTELLQRFTRATRHTFVGTPTVLAVIAGWYLRVSGMPQDADGRPQLAALGLALIVLLVALLARAVRNEFEMIYRIGTHIAVVLERDMELPWHRLSRSRSSFKPRRWSLVRGWGQDSHVYALVFLTAGAIAWIAYWNLGTIDPSEPASIPRAVWASLAVSVVASGWTAFTCGGMFSGSIQRWRRTEEATWKRMACDWNDPYPRPYSSEGPANSPDGE